MTWAEAQQAFRAQVPVSFTMLMSPRPLRCARIAEVAIRCPKGGKPYPVVGVMDENEHCIYHVRPENVFLADEDGRQRSGAEQRA